MTGAAGIPLVRPSSWSDAQNTSCLLDTPIPCRSRRPPLSLPRRGSGAVDPLAGADLYSHAGMVQCVGPVVDDEGAVACRDDAEQVTGAVLDQRPGSELFTGRGDLDRVAVVAVDHDEVTVGRQGLPSGVSSAPPAKRLPAGRADHPDMSTARAMPSRSRRRTERLGARSLAPSITWRGSQATRRSST